MNFKKYFLLVFLSLSTIQLSYAQGVSVKLKEDTFLGLFQNSNPQPQKEISLITRENFLWSLNQFKIKNHKPKLLDFTHHYDSLLKMDEAINPYDRFYLKYASLNSNMDLNQFLKDIPFSTEVVYTPTAHYNYNEFQKQNSCHMSGNINLCLKEYKEFKDENEKNINKLSIKYEKEQIIFNKWCFNHSFLCQKIKVLVALKKENHLSEEEIKQLQKNISFKSNFFYNDSQSIYVGKIQLPNKIYTENKSLKTKSHVIAEK